MFNLNEILTQMDAGMSPEEIANEFTTSLNKAIALQKEKEDKATKAKEKLADAQAVVDALNAFGAKHYPDQSTPITAEQIIDAYELVANLDVQMEKLANGLKTTVKTKGKSEKDADKIFSNFFKLYGI